MKLRLLHPRGMCAGVERAIRTVELAGERHGGPVHVRKQIVHNRHVIDRLRAEGVLFVDELGEVPNDALVVFAAHGVSPAVHADARARRLRVIDATCPLVARVHRQVCRAVDSGKQVVLVGHADHEEVIGTVGHVAPGAVTVICSAADARALPLDPNRPIVIITQTTLSAEDVDAVTASLRQQYPDVEQRPGICSATERRQSAVKAAAAKLQRLLVVGSANSSNTARLVETANRHALPARRIDSADEVNDLLLSWLSDADTVGLTSGASTPESAVAAIIDQLKVALDLEVVDDRRSASPDEKPFALPRELTKDLC